jgi:hypothetical protein
MDVNKRFFALPLEVCTCRCDWPLRQPPSCSALPPHWKTAMLHHRSGEPECCRSSSRYWLMRTTGGGRPCVRYVTKAQQYLPCRLHLLPCRGQCYSNIHLETGLWLRHIVNSRGQKTPHGTRYMLLLLLSWSDHIHTQETLDPGSQAHGDTKEGLYFG